MHGEQEQPVHRKEPAVLPLPAQAANQAEGSKLPFATTTVHLLVDRCYRVYPRGCDDCIRHWERDTGAGLDAHEEVGAEPCCRTIFLRDQHGFARNM